MVDVVVAEAHLEAEEALAIVVVGVVDEDSVAVEEADVVEAVSQGDLEVEASRGVVVAVVVDEALAVVAVAAAVINQLNCCVYSTDRIP